MINIDTIIKVVADYYCISTADILSAKRTMDIAEARHMVMYLIYERLRIRKKNIGRHFGRQHSTISYIIRKMEFLTKHDRIIALKYKNIGKLLHLESMTKTKQK